MSLSPPNAPVAQASAVRTVVVAGNPNSGKSTLFNALTGLRQKVGNYPGVTVEKKTGQCRGAHGEVINLIDLPGVYSLQTRSLDEAVARDVLLGRLPDTSPPEVIVCVVDATNLERNLYLVAQLAELGLPMVVALTMVDMAEQSGLVLQVPELAAALGCPVIPVIAAQRRGLVELRQAITQQFDGPPPASRPHSRAAGRGGEAPGRPARARTGPAFPLCLCRGVAAHFRHHGAGALGPAAEIAAGAGDRPPQAGGGRD